jgi:hypothetical protein
MTWAYIYRVQLNEAYQRREAVFLSADPWITIPYQFSTKTPRELLLDIVLDIPGLIERSDQMKQLWSTPGFTAENRTRVNEAYLQDLQCIRATEYLQECDSLLRKLQNWLNYLQASEKGPIWWLSEATADNKMSIDISRQPANLDGWIESHQSLRIQFSSARIPGLLISYWTGLLELSMAILEVRHFFHHDTLLLTSREALGVNSLSMSIEVDNLNDIAMHISKTGMLLAVSLEGCTMAYVPLKLTQDYFLHVLSNCGGHACDELMWRYGRAQIGLEWSKKALEMMKSTMRSF